jgi:SAM-dependent methyltransferase
MSKLNYRVIFGYNPALSRVLIKYLNPKKEERILDLGCGRGLYVRVIEKYTDKVIGVDISEKAIKKAVSKKVMYGDATDLSFESDSFDKVYSLHTIEHIYDSRKFLKEVARILKPEGIFVLIYPWELIRGIQALGAAIINYGNPFKARDLHLHKLNPKKIEDLIEGLPFSHVKSKFIVALGLHYLTILRKKGA